MENLEIWEFKRKFFEVIQFPRKVQFSNSKYLYCFIKNNNNVISMLKIIRKFETIEESKFSKVKS